MCEKVEIKSLKLNNGAQFPMVGLGTFGTSGDKDGFIKALKYAIKIGYRHIDGAWLYSNDEALGQAIREAIQESNGKLKREDLFIVGKVWNTFHSRENVRKNLEDSLNKIGTDYLDLYLIHWPMGFKENTGEPFPKDAEGNRLYSDVHYLETYKALEELQQEGKVKNIGVSNFNISQLKDVLNNCTIKPVNNQIEIHPYYQNDKLVEFCQKNDITVSAYAPIGAGEKSKLKPELPPVSQHPTLISIGKKYGKTPAQVSLRWLLQRNIVVLPKSVTPSRILENAQIFDFELTDEDMAEIKKLNQNLRVYGVEMLKNHKFYPFLED